MSQEKPVHEIRLGKVKGAVWLNHTESGPRYNVSFSRIYKTDKGWESSLSFGRDELPLVSKVADMAHTWIYQQKDRSDNAERNEDTPTRSRSEQRVTKSSSSR